jgi:hypothetical protein
MHEVFRLTLTGPGRRCNETTIEHKLRFDTDEAEVVADADSLAGRTLGLARRLGLPVAGQEPGPKSEPGQVYLDLVMTIQKWAGHRVGFAMLCPVSDNNEFHAVFEYEQRELAEGASRLALALLVGANPGLVWPDELGAAPTDFMAELNALRKLGRETRLPVDTQVLIEAARARYIPCVKLERFPYQALESEHRVRRNSMLKLGHCAWQTILDGTLCIDRSMEAHQLQNDRMSLIQLSEKYRFIIPFNENQYRNNKTYEEVRDAAESTRYPLVLKPRRRSHGQGVATAISDEAGLRRAWSDAQELGPEFLLESHVAGTPYRVLVANHQPLAVLDDRGTNVLETVHPSIPELAMAISRGEQVGLLGMTVVTPEPGESLVTGGGAVVDVDFAPRLDTMLGRGSGLLTAAVNGLLDWLYPRYLARPVAGIPRSGRRAGVSFRPHRAHGFSLAAL